MTKETNRDKARRRLYFAYIEGKLSIKQFKAQMKDLGYEDWEIEIYLDGDGGPE